MTLSEKKKADRIVMAQRLTNIAKSLGAIVERTERGREIHLDIETGPGLNCWISVDGDSSQPDVHVVPWFATYSRDVNFRIAEQFAPGLVNSFHRHKATMICYGWNELEYAFTRALTMINDGTAFEGGSPAFDHSDFDARR